MPFRVPNRGWVNPQDLTLELLESLPVGIVLWEHDESDDSLRLLGSNAAALAITGLRLESNFGLPMRVVFPHVSAEREAEYLRLAKTGGSRDFGEIVTRDMPGGPHFVGLRAFMLRPLVLVVVFDDRSELRRETFERARVESELRRSEALFRGLVEGARDAMVVIDAEANHLYATPSVRRIFGYEPEQFVAMKAFDLVLAEDRAGLQAALQRLVRTPGAEFESKSRAVHEDGSLRTLEVHAVNRLHEPDVGGIVCVLHDVTEREQNLAALNRTEQQLRQAQRVESIGLLAGGVAHDFNNLLSVVTGYVSMALESLPAVTPLAQELTQVMRAAERAAELTGQLLAFSRHQVLAPDVVDLNQIVSRMDKMLRRVIGEDIAFRSITQAGLSPVLVDPGQIEQVIMNLVVNARDAMPRGGALSVETANVTLNEPGVEDWETAKPGAHVVLSVADTGVGMDEATQARIFEPFFSTKERGKGTGLGLSTVLGIVQQSGGAIRCRSRVGVGTRFEILFPETTQRPRQSAPPPSAPSRLGGKETILVVEDDQQLRTLTRFVLERSGYRVLDAATGDAALTLAGGYDLGIDLLLTDVVLPGVNGVQVCERLRAQRPELKVLYVSGYADDLVIDPRVVAFLQKPVTPEVLRRKVREVLDGRPVARSR